MVRHRADPSAHEHRRDAFDGLARWRIHNGRTVGGAQQRDCRLILVVLRARWLHVICEVDAIEAGHHHFGMTKCKLTHDILSYIRRGGRGESDRLRSAETFTNQTDPSVTRSEVMPPLADAVCFVDGEKRHPDVYEPLQRTTSLEALWCEIQHLQ